MCSVVEIKTPDEIYIHYLSQHCSDGEDQSVENIQRIPIKNKVDYKEIERNYGTSSENSAKVLVNITHITQEGLENKSSDVEDKDKKDDDQTSDRASSLGSSTIDSVEIFEKVDVTVNSLTILPLIVTVETCEIATQVDQTLGDQSGERKEKLQPIDS